ncbi:SCP-2 sterol transfer family domain-containing protein [Ditylenchus destructor]|nr:SCP-2 sterol transfer family domain-containing protein [Ditylenchus destructor]
MQLSRLSKEQSIQLQQTCGLSVSMAEDRITGGDYARSGQFPWAVALAADSAGIMRLQNFLIMLIFIITTCAIFNGNTVTEASPNLEDKYMTYGPVGGVDILVNNASAISLTGTLKEIGLKLAKDGANIVICAKTTEPHPKLPGTIYTAAEEMEKAGGKVLACMVDIRDEKSVQDAVEAAVKKFGGVDILVTGTLECIPNLKQAKNPPILNLSPPLLMEPRWFSHHVGVIVEVVFELVVVYFPIDYEPSENDMGVLSAEMLSSGCESCLLAHQSFAPFCFQLIAEKLLEDPSGGSEEHLKQQIKICGFLTPMKRYYLMHGTNVRGTFMISQKCIPYLKQAKNLHILNQSPPLLMEPRWFSHHVGESKDQCRKPSIVADAAYAMLSRNSRRYTGNFAIDEDVLKKEGVTNFDQYAYDPNVALMPDAFIPDVDFNVFAGKHDQPREKSRESIKAADIDAVIAQIQKVLNPEVVQKVGAVYEFTLRDGSNVANIYMDLKNGDGSMQNGKSPAPSDVQFELSSPDFVDMFRGNFSPTTAFMQKKLNIKGNMREKNGSKRIQSLVLLCICM